MSGDGVPWAALAGPVARELLGEPTRKTAGEWRWGTNGSLCVHIAGEHAGTWRDYERGEGGGMLKLIARDTGRSKGEAIGWLREHGFIEREHAPSRAEAVEPAPSSRPAKTYDYRDANGALRFQVCRYEPKAFRQRRPDGKGGWHWNLHDIEPILYRLPELLAVTADATIYVCEGERDVDTLAEHFLPATTAPGGAGKWRETFNPTLKGRHVVILPDNDDAGEAHGEAVAQTLQGVAASVRVLKLPDLPAKGDVSDWLAGGGTAEELERLTAATPVWTPLAEAEKDTGLHDDLAIESWTTREIARSDRLLGDLVTTTTRVFLVGRTGLGKTMLGLAMACGIASGQGFLHWRAYRPARVLYIDGEMPSELIKARATDALRRAVNPPAPGNLMIYARDDEDAIATKFPTLGRMPPLNTEPGASWVLALIDKIGGIDCIFLDNVMSLLVGVQKEEEAWAGVLPLVQALTARRIGQVWLDLTGHNTDRQYGSSTKSWRFDAVGIMTPLPEGQRNANDLAFTLSFDHPGKARRRMPNNAADFATTTIRLADDQWTSGPAEGSGMGGRIPPMAKAWHKALVNTLAVADPPGAVSRTTWYYQGAHEGLAEPLQPDDTKSAKRAKQAGFRKYLSVLKVGGWVGVNGDAITNLRAVR